MDIAIIFHWFAQDSILAAKLTTDPMPRETWLRLDVDWGDRRATERQSIDECVQS
jgi:hypothetical protein